MIEDAFYAQRFLYCTLESGLLCCNFNALRRISLSLGNVFVVFVDCYSELMTEMCRILMTCPSAVILH